MSTKKEYGPNDNPVLYQESLLTEIERLKDLNFDLQKQVIPELEAKNVELEKKLADAELLRDCNASQRDAAMRSLKIAVEALRFYADRMSYSLDDYEGISGEMRSRVVLYGDSIEVNDVSSHAGRRATEALAAINFPDTKRHT